MEADYRAPARGRDDPLYDEGLTHIQAGEWAAALRCFEALAQKHPGDPDVMRSLDQARFRARLDKETKVKPKGVTIRWGRIFFRALLAVLLLAAIYFVAQFVTERVAPELAKERAAQAFAAEVTACKDLVAGGKLAEGREACTATLQKDPDNEEIQAQLALIETKEKERQLCAEAEALLAAGEYVAAREKLTDIQLLFPGSCNAPQRISDLSDRLSLEGLFGQGKEAFEAQNYGAAIDLYEQVRARSTTYEAETVSDHLHTAYLTLGQEMVNQNPPQLEQLPLALDYFTRALSFRPNDVAAQNEQRLASQLLAGQQSLDAGRLDDAIARLSAVVQMRPAYLDGLAVERLYDAYLRRGDQYRDGGDPSLAYRMYDLAAALPGVDPSSAINRRDSVKDLLTPTPTPTNTPTVTPIPTPTAYVPPAPPTPAPPLGTFRGKIVFKSTKEGEEGFWVMNPDGSQKRYLGPATSKLEAEYAAQYKKEQHSPDGRFQLYATRGVGDLTVQVYYQGRDQDGNLVTKRVTNCSKICYDPVWAPDGSRIAFVSPEWESDDIWVINPDGAEWWNYTPNKWEWDKHPSWSPDSRQIVFWSNREGTKQIFVIDANGKNLKKISGDAPWDESDPVWIK